MERQTILATPSAMLWYYPAAGGIVHHEIKRFIHGQELRDLLSRGSEVLIERHATKWLSDDRKNGALSKEDAAWAESVWRPPVLAAGWRAWAMVPPESVVGHMDISKYTAAAGALGLKVRTFSDPVTALAWLERA
jgi:hypothetical protein